MTRIRLGCASSMIMDLLYADFKVIPIAKIEIENSHEFTLVLVNGSLCGGVKDVHGCMEQFKQYRRDFSVPIDASISLRTEALCIWTDPEACYRPLLNIAQMHQIPQLFKMYGQYLHLFWNQLLLSGAIEYIDKNEEHDAYVATSLQQFIKAKNTETHKETARETNEDKDIHPENYEVDKRTKENKENKENKATYTHMELNVAHTLFGVGASMIPFLEHNQSPRLIYGSAMGKQAVAGASPNFRDFLSTKSHLLNYPQKRIVATSQDELIGAEEEPAGCVCCVAIMSLLGTNQEDSIIANRAAFERGLFVTTCFRSVREHEIRQNNDEERIGQCESDVGKKTLNYDTLEKNKKFVAPGTKVKKDDVLIPKYSISTASDNTRTQRDCSAFAKHNEQSQVQRVLTFPTKDDLVAVCVQTAAQRMPELGDKFSSYHGQKGVIGQILAPEDMPTTLDGNQIDLIINPHCIPSRMTIGHLLEMLLGEVACVEGRIADGSAFRNLTPEEINEHTLRKTFGRTMLIDGATGEMMKEPAFIGFCHYMRLKHFVCDKTHSRSTGSNQLVTRQPLEVFFFCCCCVRFVFFCFGCVHFLFSFF